MGPGQVTLSAGWLNRQMATEIGAHMGKIPFPKFRVRASQKAAVLQGEGRGTRAPNSVHSTPSSVLAVSPWPVNLIVSQLPLDNDGTYLPGLLED